MLGSISKTASYRFFGDHQQRQDRERAFQRYKNAQKSVDNTTTNTTTLFSDMVLAVLMNNRNLSSDASPIGLGNQFKNATTQYEKYAKTIQDVPVVFTKNIRA